MTAESTKQFDSSRSRNLKVFLAFSGIPVTVTSGFNTKGTDVMGFLLQS